ncbi:MAG TPA: sigma-70 family RNA polymerase sigma factor [Bryobacteraceae bacterium]|jgi:RNA polymerase sigma factor (TIGR02999 family)
MQAVSGSGIIAPHKGEELSRDLSHELTELLQGWSGGDRSALEAIVNRTYSELRRIARRCLSVERPGHTLQATVLVHEAYLQLVHAPQVQWQDRAHFFAIVAKLMRRILIDYARARGSEKRGGQMRRVNLDEALVVAAELDPAILHLDEALKRLATFDPRKARVVEMRYFGGLTAGEISSVLGISTQSVNRDWGLAKAWLARDMSKAREMREGECDGRPTLGNN